MTKALGSQQFQYLVDKIGVHNIYAPSWGGVLKMVEEWNCINWAADAIWMIEEDTYTTCSLRCSLL